MNTANQLKAFIRNISKAKRVNAQILLRNYMLKRLLERISVSKYKNNFILKGGMLIAAMVGIDTCSTMDMDATIKGVPVSISKDLGQRVNPVRPDIFYTGWGAGRSTS